jgi:hypothetical protein
MSSEVEALLKDAEIRNQRGPNITSVFLQSSSFPSLA